MKLRNLFLAAGLIVACSAKDVAKPESFYFVTGENLWKTSGTAESTIPIETGLDSIDELMVVNGTPYVAAKKHGSEAKWWKVDSETGNTVQVGNGYSYPTHAVFLDDKIFFLAYDGVAGTRLWKTDGTDEGTFQVQGDYLNATDLTVVNDSLYFVASTTPESQSGNNTDATQDLWKSDGTAQGTVKLGGGFSSFHKLAVFGETIVVSDGSGNIWVMTNGADRAFVKMVTSHGVPCDKFVAAGGAFFSKCYTGLYQLNPGETEVSEIASTVYYRPMSNLVVVKDVLYFLNDGTLYSVANGTSPTRVGAGYIAQSGGYPSLRVLGDTIYFFAEDTDATSGYAYGVRLWKSDGTNEGTVPVGNIEFSNFPENFVEFGNSLYAQIGNRLWVSDGTVNGTVQILNDPSVDSADFLPGPGNDLYLLTDAPYSYYSGPRGHSIWKINGLERPTVVKDSLGTVDAGIFNNATAIE